ncbi:potassium channel family protein [Nonomuraea cavernae]|uniref:NAD-binding protein of Kef-type K+ transporter n=1 Tax=Nonomuraea cavernae TaxID=2045107 RepID=A0A918DI82_9ACTN|nr:potassium channel family protein [Nonomuraea cavernae]MCA2187263.1 potassium channel family protein [Nonomuraea cavernae]GGO68077.1 NAD-binding protein of Kef-type K+ transporter [Nonomuraea cavernae]
MREDESETGVRLPVIPLSPLRAVLRRMAIAAAIVLAMFALVAMDLDGYRDTADGKVSLLDALYYVTVSISTTGYGDITPVSSEARIINIVAVTPLRIAFLVVLVGTTLEVLTRRTRDAIRIERWRARLHDHTVIIGYGTKGRAAIRTLLENERTRDSIVVVDPQPAMIDEATADGFVGVVGDGTRSHVLNRARIGTAKEIIVATQRDDTSALVTLTARSLNPTATIVAAVREAENDPLVRQSGADVVITSSEAAGRMLGVATQSPAVSTLIEDFLAYGRGLDLFERAVAPEEVGRPPSACEEIVVAVVRGREVMTYADPRVSTLRAGDRVVVIHVPAPG